MKKQILRWTPAYAITVCTVFFVSSSFVSTRTSAAAEKISPAIEAIDVEERHSEDDTLHNKDGVHLDYVRENVSEGEGLAAWDRIYEVFSHPRCANCHTGSENIPMWTSNIYGGTKPHGMNINAGDSRIGAETIPCSACHLTSTAPNTVPHAAPHAGLPWQLAPVEFEWFGVDSPSICKQTRDPARNGGRDGVGLVEHITHDMELKAFIVWGFSPGGGRDPAPGTIEEHLEDMIVWTSAGMPCPEDNRDG